MAEEEIKPNETATIRDEKGLFLKGTAPGPGAPKQTEEDRMKKEALKKVKSEYIEKLTEALPEISPALIEKAKTGDVGAIKEINDRIFGKSPQNVSLDGGEDEEGNIKPVLVKFINGKDDRNSE